VPEMVFCYVYLEKDEKVFDIEAMLKPIYLRKSELFR